MSRWTAADTAAWLTPPLGDDDKYSRGVLGFATGSVAYPGAAVLGVEAALHTGVGMVRYLGPAEVGRLVLARRPEAVLGGGRVDAWVVGSGVPGAGAGSAAGGEAGRSGAGGGDAVRGGPRRSGADQGGAARVDTEQADAAEADAARFRAALGSGAPVVLDAGSIGHATTAAGPVIVTPHAGELAALLGVPREAVLADPVRHASAGAARLGAVLLLKGATTRVVDPEADEVIEIAEATPWLATAGAGDALAGVLGAVIAARAARVASVVRVPGTAEPTGVAEPTRVARTTAPLGHPGPAARPELAAPLGYADLAARPELAAPLGHSDLAALGAAAASLHGRAARLAARADPRTGLGGGPFTILDLCAALPEAVRALLG